jgi:hypothetical protein
MTDDDNMFFGPTRRIRNMKPIRCNEVQTRRSRQARGSSALLRAIFATGKTYGPIQQECRE